MSRIQVSSRPAQRPTRRAVVACVCAVALTLLAGCGADSSAGGESGSSEPAAGSGSSSSSAVVISIHDFAFTTPTSVSPGATITVDNMDGVAHTVTADGGRAFDLPAPAGSSTFTAPSEPGTYPFHCNIHPEMHGTLVVQ